MSFNFLFFKQISNVILIWFAYHIYWIYISRFSAGVFAGAAYVMIPLFLNEITISDDKYGINTTKASTIHFVININRHFLLLQYPRLSNFFDDFSCKFWIFTCIHFGNICQYFCNINIYYCVSGGI